MVDNVQMRNFLAPEYIYTSSTGSFDYFSTVKTVDSVNDCLILILIFLNENQTNIPAEIKLASFLCRNYSFEFAKGNNLISQEDYIPVLKVKFIWLTWKRKIYINCHEVRIKRNLKVYWIIQFIFQMKLGVCEEKLKLKSLGKYKYIQKCNKYSVIHIWIFI